MPQARIMPLRNLCHLVQEARKKTGKTSWGVKNPRAAPSEAKILRGTES